MNKCPMCGFDFNNGSICPKCGFDIEKNLFVENFHVENIVKQNNNSNAVEVDDKYRSDAKKLMIVHYILFGLSAILDTNKLIPALICISSIVTIITARIKFKKLKYVRVTFDIELCIYIGLAILLILSLIFINRTIDNINNNLQGN